MVDIADRSAEEKLDHLFEGTVKHAREVYAEDGGHSPVLTELLP